MPQKSSRKVVGCLSSCVLFSAVVWIGILAIEHAPGAYRALVAMPATDRQSLCILAAAALHAIMVRRSR